MPRRAAALALVLLLPAAALATRHDRHPPNPRLLNASPRPQRLPLSSAPTGLRVVFEPRDDLSCVDSSTLFLGNARQRCNSAAEIYTDCQYFCSASANAAEASEGVSEYVFADVLPAVAAALRDALAMPAGEAASATQLAEQEGCGLFEGVDVQPRNVSGADVVVLVTHRPATDPLLRSFGHACQVDASGRTVLGQLNLSPSLIAEQGLDTSALQRLVLHEMLHLLGFSLFHTDSFAASAETVTHGESKTALTLPTMLEAARERFACSSLPYVELEGADELGSHLEQRIFNTELMTAEFLTESADSPLGVSSVMRGFFVDLGWYIAGVDSAIEPADWGVGLGCDWAIGSCGLWTVEQHGCADSTGAYSLCSDDHSGPLCHWVDYGTNMLSAFRYISGIGAKSRTVGGPSAVADFCPRPAAQACADYSDADAAVVTHFDGEVGVRTRCASATDGSVSLATCYPARCLSEADLRVATSTEWLECGGVATPLAINAQSALSCPSVAKVCTEAEDFVSWPVIEAVVPSRVNTEANVVLTVQGTGFPSRDIELDVGGSSCRLSLFESTKTLLCLTPSLVAQTDTVASVALLAEGRRVVGLPGALTVTSESGVVVDATMLLNEEAGDEDNLSAVGQQVLSIGSDLWTDLNSLEAWGVGLVALGTFLFVGSCCICCVCTLCGPTLPPEDIKRIPSSAVQKAAMLRYNLQAPVRARVRWWGARRDLRRLHNARRAAAAFSSGGKNKVAPL